jgi:hypothetical protein
MVYEYFHSVKIIASNQYSPICQQKSSHFCFTLINKKPIYKFTAIHYAPPYSCFKSGRKIEQNFVKTHERIRETYLQKVITLTSMSCLFCGINACGMMNLDKMLTSDVNFM